MADYKSIFELVKHFNSLTSCVPNHLEILKIKQGDYYWADDCDSLPPDLEWVNCGKDFPSAKLVLMENHAGLFRGQTDVYSPCYSKAYRGFPLVKRPRELSEENRVRFLVSQAKTLWYIHLLQKHPSVLCAKIRNIKMDPYSIAQHYGMSTPYLDLTQSIEIASFFACCEYRDNAWQPKLAGKGVIYSFAPILDAEMIGLVTFSRPVLQKAWFIFLPLGEDFEKVSRVDKLIFNHTPEGSRYYLEKFNYGKDLFPEDPAADLARDIITSNSIPKNFISEALLRFGCIPDNIEKTLSTFKDSMNKYCNLAVEDNVPIFFTDDQIKKAESCFAKHADRFNDFKGYVRPVRKETCKVI
ncbi:MAG: FRG domain-containing protein [Dehalococcoidales bacterium]|jgi:hypothetical protein